MEIYDITLVNLECNSNETNYAFSKIILKKTGRTYLQIVHSYHDKQVN